MKIKVLGAHNAESKYTALSCLLIDGKIVVDAGSLTSKLSFGSQSKIKLILLTHGHYDHLRDIPAFAFSNACLKTKVFGTKETLDILSTHLIDGKIYPDFSRNNPVCGTQTLEYNEIKPFDSFDYKGYKIKALPLNHIPGSVGYEIISEEGKSVFISGDTGPGLKSVWENISPDVIIIELTFPNEKEDVAKNSGHFVPKTLKNELTEFKQFKGYLPKIYVYHLTAMFEKKIKKEVEDIEECLDIKINFAVEGDEIII